jgi:hypothetical protein
VCSGREGEELEVGNRRREEKTVRLERWGGVILYLKGEGAEVGLVHRPV